MPLLHVFPWAHLWTWAFHGVHAQHVHRSWLICGCGREGACEGVEGADAASCRPTRVYELMRAWLHVL